MANNNQGTDEGLRGRSLNGSQNTSNATSATMGTSGSDAGTGLSGDPSSENALMARMPTFIQDFDVEEAVEPLREAVRANPLRSLGISLGVGLLLGKILG
jgi:hypothetical protein